MIELHIPLEVQSQNVTERMHWRVRHRLQKAWAAHISAKVGRCQRPTVRMVVTVHAYRRRLITDHANLIGGAKMVIDAIRDTGLIFDDSDRWMVAAYVQELVKFSPEPYKGRPSTLITLQIEGSYSAGQLVGTSDAFFLS